MSKPATARASAPVETPTLGRPNAGNSGNQSVVPQDIRRLESVTFSNYVKYHGHKTEKYLAEWDVNLNRFAFELRADYGRRVIMIRHIESGSRREVGFEACVQWNPYPSEEDVPDLSAPKKAG